MACKVALKNVKQDSLKGMKSKQNNKVYLTPCIQNVIFTYHKCKNISIIFYILFSTVWKLICI